MGAKIAILGQKVVIGQKIEKKWKKMEKNGIFLEFSENRGSLAAKVR
jgi:hypothetical protein